MAGPVPVRRKILVVDDEPALANTLALLLRDRHDVTVATSGREALDILLESAEFDAILCDLTMPGVSGIDLHARLEQTRPALARRLIFMTGGSFTQKTSDFLADVANPVIEKPFTIDAIEDAIRALGER